jgi:hypothetical protein
MGQIQALDISLVQPQLRLTQVLDTIGLIAQLLVLLQKCISVKQMTLQLQGLQHLMLGMIQLILVILEPFGQLPLLELINQL